jgi:hypothetical protein
MLTFVCNEGHISRSASSNESAPCGTCGSEHNQLLTDAQAATVERLRRDFGEITYARLRPFDLPEGYVELTFGSFTAGIAQDGAASS